MPNQEPVPIVLQFQTENWGLIWYPISRLLCEKWEPYA